MRRLGIVVLFGFAFSQPGALDFSFNFSDRGYGEGDDVQGPLTAFLPLPNNSLLIAAAGERKLYRLDARGYVDSTFKPFVQSNLMAIAQQADGKILIPGYRLLPNGEIDYAYNSGYGFWGLLWIRSILLLPDGSHISGGNFYSYDRFYQMHLVKIRPNGSVEPSFRISLDGPVWCVVRLPNGQILIGGEFRNVNGKPFSYLARIDENGVLDTTFQAGIDSAVYTISVEPSGAAIIGGQFQNCQGHLRGRIARLYPDGSLDTNFARGAGANGAIYVVRHQSDGKVVIGGDFTSYDEQPRSRLVRLFSNGELDTSFFTGSGFDGPVHLVDFQSDGKILVGGSFTSYNDIGRKYLVRLLPDGTYDFSYRIPTGASGPVYTLYVGSDSLIYAGGNFSFYFADHVPFLVRLLPDGKRDTSFHTGTGPNGPVWFVTGSKEGTLMIGGEFTAYDGRPANRVARLYPNGALDTSFQSNINTGAIYTLLSLANGSILIGGTFYHVEGGRPYGGIARLFPNGRLDTSFVPIRLPYFGIFTVRSLHLLADSSVVVGITSQQSTSSVSYVGRLLRGGEWDSTFVGPAMNGTIYTITSQPDGKILIGGNFTLCDSFSCYGIVRLLPTGAIDSTFQVGAGIDGFQRSVYAILVERDGRIIVGGNFQYYNGVSTPYLVRLLGNGSVDISFQTDSGLNGSIHALAAFPGERVLIAGAFTQYANTGRNRIARIYGGPATYLSLPSSSPPPEVFPNPFSSYFTIRGRKGQKFLLYNLQGQCLRSYILFESQVTLWENLPPGVYLLRDEEGTYFCRLVVVE